MLFIGAIVGLAANAIFGQTGKAPSPEEEDDPFAAMYAKVKQGEMLAGGLGTKPSVTRSMPAGAKKSAMTTKVGGPKQVVQSGNPMKSLVGNDDVCFGGT